MATLFQRPETGTYYVQFFHEGRQRKEKVGKNRREAELRLKEIEVALARGTLEARPIATTLTAPPPVLTIASVPLGEFLARYLDWSRKTLSAKTSKDDHEARLPKFVRFVGETRPVASVTREEVERFKGDRLSRVSAATVWGELKTVAAFLQKAVEWGHAGTNVAKGVKKPKLAKALPRFLTEKEVEVLLASSSDNKVRGVVAVGVYAGLRKTEMAWLEWSDIDFERRLLHVQPKQGWHPKNYKPRTIPLHSKLAEILLELPRLSRWVLANNDGSQYANNMLRDVKRVARNAKITKCGLHVLRHTFASLLVMRGVSVYKVSQWLGHADVKTTMIYAHLQSRDEDIERL